MIVGTLVALIFGTNFIYTNASEVPEPTRVDTETVDFLSKEEILWFARALYSETKREEEQILIAWVIRNRVESDRFPDGYKEVVLQPKQFSGLNATDEQYFTNISRNYGENGPGWNSALDVAETVYRVSPAFRPFSSYVFNFYSPKSLTHTPSWASEIDPIYVIRDLNKELARFAFYEGIK